MKKVRSLLLLIAGLFLFAACSEVDVEAIHKDTLPLCSAVESTEVQAPIELRIENRRTEAVNLEIKDWCSDQVFELRDANDSALQTVRRCWSDNSEGCYPAGVYKLPAGATLVKELAAEYYGEPLCQQEDLSEGTRCTGRSVLPDGAYSISVSWCDASSGADAGDCTADAGDSGCFVFGTFCGTASTSVSVNWEYPAGGSVLLTIE